MTSTLPPVDRHGVPISMGDVVQVHLDKNKYHVGTVSRIGPDFVYVTLDIWKHEPGGMLPGNLTVLDGMDIGL